MIAEREFRRIFEAAPDRYLVLDLDLTIVAASDAYLRATMTERDSVLGRPLFEVFPDNPDDAGATGVGNLRASLGRVLSRRAADVMNVQKYDIRRPASEGSAFEERYWSPVNVPVFVGDQNKFIIHRVEDVTELVRLRSEKSGQRRITAELKSRLDRLETEVLLRGRELERASAELEKESRERSRAQELLDRLFETVADHAIVLLDRDGTIASWNEGAKRINGYRAEEVLGRHFSILYPKEDVEAGKCERALRAAVESAGKCERARRAAVESGPFHEEGWRVRKGGARYVATVAITALKDKDGDIRGFAKITRDVTERNTSEAALSKASARLEDCEARLRQSQKMEAVGTLAGGIAHDFNNLLTAINGFSEMVLLRLSKHDPIRREVEEIKRAGYRAASLTRQLLAFSRKQVMQPKVLDVNAVVADIARMLRRIIGDNVELVTRTADSLGMVKVDPGQLEQVIVNLVVNARDAMPSGGKLTLETMSTKLDPTFTARYPDVPSGAYVVIAISDTGTGMSPEALSHLFEPFFTTKGHGKGTGLGLSTVYGIVKQSGGHVSVHSEQGKGTTFKIYLPQVAEAPEPHESSTRIRLAPGGSETILLVEDEEVVRALARSVLEMNGYKVIEAANGEEALQLFEHPKLEIDLLLTDVVLPGMNGRELYERVLAERPKLRVLYSSGYTADAIVHDGVLDPGIAFIQKPYSPASLAREVRAVLDAPKT
jgi:two-component system, cell cycle sensor histidine kinase and response regulator CckA